MQDSIEPLPIPQTSIENNGGGGIPPPNGPTAPSEPFGEPRYNRNGHFNLEYFKVGEILWTVFTSVFTISSILVNVLGFFYFPALWYFIPSVVIPVSLGSVICHPKLGRAILVELFAKLAYWYVHSSIYRFFNNLFSKTKLKYESARGNTMKMIGGEHWDVRIQNLIMSVFSVVGMSVVVVIVYATWSFFKKKSIKKKLESKEAEPGMFLSKFSTHIIGILTATGVLVGVMIKGSQVISAFRNFGSVFSLLFGKDSDRVLEKGTFSPKITSGNIYKDIINSYSPLIADPADLENLATYYTNMAHGSVYCLKDQHLKFMTRVLEEESDKGHTVITNAHGNRVINFSSIIGRQLFNEIAQIPSTNVITPMTVIGSEWADQVVDGIHLNTQYPHLKFKIGSYLEKYVVRRDINSYKIYLATYKGTTYEVLSTSDSNAKHVLENFGPEYSITDIVSALKKFLKTYTYHLAALLLVILIVYLYFFWKTRGERVLKKEVKESKLKQKKKKKEAKENAKKRNLNDEIKEIQKLVSEFEGKTNNWSSKGQNIVKADRALQDAEWDKLVKNRDDLRIHLGKLQKDLQDDYLQDTMSQALITMAINDANNRLDKVTTDIQKMYDADHSGSVNSAKTKGNQQNRGQQIRALPSAQKKDIRKGRIPGDDRESADNCPVHGCSRKHIQYYDMCAIHHSERLHDGKCVKFDCDKKASKDSKDSFRFCSQHQPPIQEAVVSQPGVPYASERQVSGKMLKRPLVPLYVHSKGKFIRNGVAFKCKLPNGDIVFLSCYHVTGPACFFKNPQGEFVTCYFYKIDKDLAYSTTDALMKMPLAGPLFLVAPKINYGSTENRLFSLAVDDDSPVAVACIGQYNKNRDRFEHTADTHPAQCGSPYETKTVDYVHQSTDQSTNTNNGFSLSWDEYGPYYEKIKSNLKSLSPSLTPTGI